MPASILSASQTRLPTAKAVDSRVFRQSEDIASQTS
jgi:hypothetical protein